MATLLALLSLWLTPQAPLSAQDLAQRLDGRFNSLQTLQADFVESQTGQPTESGVLYLRQPGKMRWDYQSPAHHVFLVDGKQVWQYVPGDTAPVTATPLSAVDDFHTPLRFLLGHTNLEKELAGLGYGGLPALDPADWVLHGLPPNPPPGQTAAWREVWLEITPDYDITRVVVDAVNGTRTEIRFAHIESNHPIPASMFVYP